MSSNGIGQYVLVRAPRQDRRRGRLLGIQLERVTFSSTANLDNQYSSGTEEAQNLEGFISKIGEARREQNR